MPDALGEVGGTFGGLGEGVTWLGLTRLARWLRDEVQPGDDERMIPGSQERSCYLVSWTPDPDCEEVDALGRACVGTRCQTLYGVASEDLQHRPCDLYLVRVLDGPHADETLCVYAHDLLFCASVQA